MTTRQTAYGTRLEPGTSPLEGYRLVSPGGTTVATFRTDEKGVRAWEILAAFEEKWGDSVDTFDALERRRVRDAWKGAGAW